MSASLTSAQRAGARLLPATMLAAMLAMMLPMMLPALLPAQSRDTTLRLAADAVVDVTIRTGRLVVRGVDGSSGTVRATGHAYQLRSTGVTLAVMTRDADGRGDERVVELDVPRSVRLVVSTVSGDVDVRGITGGVDVRGTSGDVQLDRVEGRVIVETISGDVSVTGGSTVRVRTVSGSMRLRDVRGAVELHTTSGDAEVRGIGLTSVLSESMSGDVHLDGDLDAAARLQLRTHSGDVSVRLPDGAHGRLDWSTITGTLATGGPLTLLPGSTAARSRTRQLQRYEFGAAGGRAGAGLQIDITTFTGDLRLTRSPRP